VTHRSLPIDTLAAHFTAVFNHVSDPVPIVFCDEFKPADDALDQLSSLDEVEAAFGGLDRGTAPGVTRIGNDVLLDLFRLPDGPNFFLHLFNACLLGGHLPDAWRCTEIFLLYKGKGDVGDPGSYRGIALMESTLKLYKRLLFNTLSVWARCGGLIPDCQFGFHPRSSTLDAVFVFFTLLVKYVTVQGSSLFVCLVDFQKAFPLVNRALLLDKLGNLGVSSHFRRCLNSIFAGNTFALRQGGQVTAEFPMTTGLREGRVLSPLLFILFMADVCDHVLLPFQHDEFMKRDPTLNSVPIPGLLYADNLVLFCLTANLLRVRLRRLCAYAGANSLMVNVSKCEVVNFGRCVQPVTFEYNRETIPVRRSCKYLGVWLDSSLSGKALAEAVTHKFVTAVPVFFGLCRRLQLARLDLVHCLANALLFSLLYGCEFLTRPDMIEKCDVAWWKGWRAFYGLPNRVSTVALRLTFPSVAIRDLVIREKFGLLFRGSGPLATLFPEAIVCDRSYLLAVHRKGYSQSLKEWCQFYYLEAAFDAGSLSEVKEVLVASGVARREAEWERVREHEVHRFRCIDLPFFCLFSFFCHGGLQVWCIRRQSLPPCHHWRSCHFLC
jgi:hypothetical protein